MLYIYGVGDDFTLIVKGENKLEITNSAGGVLVYSVDVPTQKIVLEENAVLDVATTTATRFMSMAAIWKCAARACLS